MIILGKRYVIGSRKSRLALKQCDIVKDKLKAQYPEHEFVVKTIETKGDRERDKKLSEMNTEGIFIREIEYALLAGEIDLAVHSFKDLPTKLPAELEVAAVVDRAERLDVLVGSDQKLADLPNGARLGTGSLRRRSQLLAYRPDLEIVPIRGNVDTRIRKMKDNNLSGVILAAAGLLRLGLEDKITEYIDADICLPAARQGAVAVEIKKENKELQEILKGLEEENVVLEVWAEHAFLEAMNAGCHAPIAAQAVISGEEMIISAAVGELDGSRVIRLEKTVDDLNLNAIKKAGRELAAAMLDAGAGEIIAGLELAKKNGSAVKNKAKVYLIGAGPGDPELLTLKAKRVLGEADVILYDRLANNRLLEHASADAEMFYVGKKAADHYLSQSEIEKLMVEKAEAGNIVCRLKGGDPFIYGRGGEEALRLQEAGIDFEIIPGISSSTAAPMYAGIPLTHRHVASSFAVITGHEAADKEESTIEIEKIAAAVDTLVILMGVGNLSKISERVIAAGRNPDTPTALVSWGTRSNQQTVVGTISNIKEEVDKAGLKAPAVIIIGEVVKLRENLNWFEKKSLFGKNILVTRPAEQADTLISQIEAEAGSAICSPTIVIEEAADKRPLREALKGLDNYTHLIFTSVNGVKYFTAELEELGKDMRSLAGLKIMAIGSKTAEKLKEKGIRADYLPDDYSTDGILNSLKELHKIGELKPEETSFLLPRANIAPKRLQNALREMGAEVDNLTAYQTQRVMLKPEVLEMIWHDKLDLLTFTSSSTVEYFIKGIEEVLKTPEFEGLDAEEFFEKLRSIPTAAIGPVTAAAAAEHGLNTAVTAEEYTIEGLMEAVIKYMEG
jgi:uroporphyrinogen III methyltransferase/synthase